MLSYKAVIEKFKEFADAHFIVKSYGTGEAWQIIEHNKQSNRRYPMMWVEDMPFPTSGVIGQAGVTTYAYRVYFLQQVPTLKNTTLTTLEQANVVRAKSDMLQCAQDLQAYWGQDHVFDELDLDRNTLATPFHDILNDSLTGFYIDIKLEQAFSYNSCAVPMSGVTPPPSTTCDPATYKNSDGSFSQEIVSGATFNSSDIIVTINGAAQPASKTNVNLSFTVSGQSKNIYYNRPWLKAGTSYSTNDEPDRQANGGNAYNESIPDLATKQALDFTGGLMDKVLYFNFYDHKFRFVGINGGYCDPSDGLYYDSDGVLSTKLIEFPLFNVTSYWIIDTLTGFMLPAAAFGNSSYSNNLTTAAASTVEGFSDYFVFSRDELYTLADGSYNNCIHPSFRPPFNNTAKNWSCTPWQVAPSTNAFAFDGALGGSTAQQGYNHAGFAGLYGRIHLTGFVTQP